MVRIYLNFIKDGVLEDFLSTEENVITIYRNGYLILSYMKVKIGDEINENFFYYFIKVSYFDLYV